MYKQAGWHGGIVGTARKAGITVGIMVAVIVGVAAISTAAEQAPARDAGILAYDMRQYLTASGMPDDLMQVYLGELDECNTLNIEIHPTLNKIDQAHSLEETW